MIDLLVAGGGPAGLAAAIYAAKAGLSVAVIEPRKDPIDKACGEGIMPAGRALLERMGVELESGVPFVGVRYHRNGSTATGRFLKGVGLGVRRVDLSAAMWQRASELGVERLQDRVREVEQSAGHVRAGGVSARWLVAADGLHSSIRRILGIALVPDRPGRFGIRRHFLTRHRAEFVDVYWGDSHEAYVTPVADGLVGVAILSSDPKGFENGLGAFPQLCERLGESVGNTQGAGPFRRFSSQVSMGRVVLVGDAAGFLDPVTGEGVRLAFESAELAVRCILRGSLDDYEAGWRTIVRRYRWITSALLGLRRNRYAREAIVPVLGAVPFAFDSLLDVLGGASTTPPH